MRKIFSIRLDEVADKNLHLLADYSHRSRASVIRWLINNASIEHDLLSPRIRRPIDNVDANIHRGGVDDNTAGVKRC